MRTFDFSPLFRSTVGFDRLAHLMDGAMRTSEAAISYPPYNIVTLGEDAYRITMAVAGFGPGDIGVTVKEDTLTIAGKSAANDEDAAYLHRGIARRAFERRFDLAGHIKVKDATLENGLLHVDLVREVPEELKPRTIEIKTGAPASLAGKAKKLIAGSSKKAA
ncbi:MAG: Hsp20 family protein [Rhodospirillales bacterium]